MSAILDCLTAIKAYSNGKILAVAASNDIWQSKTSLDKKAGFLAIMQQLRIKMLSYVYVLFEYQESYKSWKCLNFT